MLKGQLPWGLPWATCTDRSLWIWTGVGQTHSLNRGNWVMQQKVKHPDLMPLTKYFQCQWRLLPSIVHSKPYVGHALVTDLGQCPVFFFNISLQTYIYKTGTHGVTVFDQQMCETACEILMALLSLDWFKTYSAKNIQNAEFTAHTHTQKG